MVAGLFERRIIESLGRSGWAKTGWTKLKPVSGRYGNGSREPLDHRGG